MRYKKLLFTVLVFALILGVSAALADGIAGGPSDPLVTKSYVDGTFHDQVLAGPLESLSDTMMALQSKIGQAATTSGAGVSVKAAAKNGVLHLDAGSGIALLSGSGASAGGTGTLIDLTTGEALGTGASLSAGHRYLAAENARFTVTLAGPSRLAFYGSAYYTGTSKLSFADVAENAWYYNDVLYAVDRGLVSGRSFEAFAPDEGLTIAEAVKLAACMNQLHATGSVTLQGGAGPLWYRSYADYAKQNGIIDKDYANYDAKITRSEFVKLFYNALPASEYAEKNAVADNAVPDVKMTDTNAKEIYAFYRAGILVGSGNGLFNPSLNISRSEVAAILTRIYDPTARKTITLR